MIEGGKATPGQEGEATHERLLDACVRALYAVVANEKELQIVPDTGIFKFSSKTNEPTKLHTDLGPTPVDSAGPAESQTLDSPKTGSHESTIPINGTVRSVLKERYRFGRLGVHIHF